MESTELQRIINDLPRRVQEVFVPDTPVVVTSCAGFIGSTLTEALLAMGSRVVFSEVLAMLKNILTGLAPDLKANITYGEAAKGDVKNTFADRTHVEATIGYRPTIPFRDGLVREAEWAVARRPQV